MQRRCELVDVGGSLPDSIGDPGQLIHVRDCAAGDVAVRLGKVVTELSAVEHVLEVRVRWLRAESAGTDRDAPKQATGAESALSAPGSWVLALNVTTARPGARP